MNRASLHVDTQHYVGANDRRLFSGFLEHLGRGVCEGVYVSGRGDDLTAGWDCAYAGHRRG